MQALKINKLKHKFNAFLFYFLIGLRCLNNVFVQGANGISNILGLFNFNFHILYSVTLVYVYKYNMFETHVNVIYIIYKQRALQIFAEITLFLQRIVLLWGMKFKYENIFLCFNFCFENTFCGFSFVGIQITELPKKYTFFTKRSSNQGGTGHTDYYHTHLPANKKKVNPSRWNYLAQQTNSSKIKNKSISYLSVAQSVKQPPKFKLTYFYMFHSRYTTNCGEVS